MLRFHAFYWQRIAEIPSHDSVIYLQNIIGFRLSRVILNESRFKKKINLRIVLHSAAGINITPMGLIWVIFWWMVMSHSVRFQVSSVSTLVTFKSIVLCLLHVGPSQFQVSGDVLLTTIEFATLRDGHGNLTLHFRTENGKIRVQKTRFNDAWQEDPKCW